MLLILCTPSLPGKRLIADLDAETEAAGRALPRKQVKIQVRYTPFHNRTMSDTPFKADPHLCLSCGLRS